MSVSGEFGPPNKIFKAFIDGVEVQIEKYNEQVPVNCRFMAFLSQVEEVDDKLSDFFFELMPYDWFGAASGIGRKRTYDEAFGEFEDIPATTYFMNAVPVKDFMSLFSITSEDDVAEGSWYTLSLTEGQAGTLYGDLSDPDDHSDPGNRFSLGSEFGVYSLYEGRLICLPTMENTSIKLVAHSELRNDSQIPELEGDDFLRRYLNRVMNSGYRTRAIRINPPPKYQEMPEPPEGQPFFTDSEFLNVMVDDPTIRNIGVMNVGAANCALLFDKNHDPVIYYDMGFPLGFYKRSAPPALADGTEPPILDNGKTGNDQLAVVLSHWDWDHWRLGYMANAVNMPWIFARQPIGGSALTFKRSMNNSYHVPTTLPGFVSNKGFAITHCYPGVGMTTPSAIMNNTGLAMRVTMLLPGTDGTQHDFGLTGDCNFNNSGMVQTNLSGILAVHHGSSNHEASDNLPSPVTTNGFIAYSYGIIKDTSGNPVRRAYDFPRLQAINNYKAMKWGTPFTTATNETNGCSTAEGHDINTGTTFHNAPGNIMVGPVFTVPVRYNGTAFYNYPHNLN